MTLPRPPREVAFLSLGAVAALGLIVLVPNLSVDYGVLRAFQQTLLVVAPVMAAGLWMVLRHAGLPGGDVVAVVPVVLLLILSGVLPALLGGQQERLALSNSGAYYDRFYSSDSEAQAIAWLAATDAATAWTLEDHRQPQRHREDARGERQRGAGRGPAVPDAAHQGRVRVRRRADPREGTLDGLLHRRPDQLRLPGAGSWPTGSTSSTARRGAGSTDDACRDRAGCGPPGRTRCWRTPR